MGKKRKKVYLSPVLSERNNFVCFLFCFEPMMKILEMQRSGWMIKFEILNTEKRSWKQREIAEAKEQQFLNQGDIDFTK